MCFVGLECREQTADCKQFFLTSRKQGRGSSVSGVLVYESNRPPFVWNGLHPGFITCIEWGRGREKEAGAPRRPQKQISFSSRCWGFHQFEASQILDDPGFFKAILAS